MKLLREYLRGLLVEIAIGQCYPHAVKMAQGSTDEEFNDLTRFKVVHGRITDKFSGESVLHAWVEKGDMIFDWQTRDTKPDGIDRETYYDIFQPEIHDEYTAEETMVNCLKSGQAGPWLSSIQESKIEDVKNWIREFPGKAKEFFQDLKQEAEETAMMGGTLAKSFHGYDLTGSEVEFVKDQLADIGKGTVIGAAAVAPGGSVLVPFLMKAADKLGVDLVPSAFKDEEVVKEVLTREYIRQILLESKLNPKIEAQLEKALKMGVDFSMMNFGPIGGDRAAIDIRLVNREGRQIGQLQASYRKSTTGPCNGAAVISGAGVRASHGLGPLLYDLAFEIAEKKGLQGLGPDPREVSSDATAVWDYYLNSRPDIEARQRDFMESPQTEDPNDDCHGQKDLAKKFGGTEKSYSSSEHIPPKYFDDPEEGYIVPTGYTPEFVEYYFDPKNSLSKTYHKITPGTPILDRLEELNKLSPAYMKDLGMPQSKEKIMKYLEDNPKKWPLKSYGGKDQFRIENRLPLEDVLKKWQGKPTP